MKRSPFLRLALCVSAFLLIFMLAAPLPGAADFGDFGGDSGGDFGGDFGGWDSSDWGDIDFDFSDIGDFGLPHIILIVIVLWVVIHGLTHQPTSSGPAREGSLPAISLREYICQYDPALDPEQLKLWIKKLYCDMQTGWESGDITNVQDRFTADAWNRFNNQLAAKTAAGETGHTRGIRFEEVELMGVNRNEGQDVLVVRLSVQLNLWHTRGQTIVSNNPNALTRMTYEWQLVRPTGQKTAPANTDGVHCPNCGNTVDTNAFAICPFCGTQLARPGVTWALNNIQGLVQATLSYQTFTETPAETAARIEQEARDKGVSI